MNYISAQINDYHAEDRPIHCVVCDKDGMTGVSVTFDSGFMQNVDMCMDCMQEVMAFKERVTDPQVKAAQRGGSAEDYAQPEAFESEDAEHPESYDEQAEEPEAYEEPATPEPVAEEIEPEPQEAEPSFPPAPVAAAPEPESSGYGWVPPANETPQEEPEAQEAEFDEETDEKVAEAQSAEFDDPADPALEQPESFGLDEPQQSELDSF